MYRYVMKIEGLNSREDVFTIRKLLNSEETTVVNISFNKGEVTIDTDDLLENICFTLEGAGYLIEELEMI
ncbi:MAG: hypothetical protein IKD84_04890 [Erysipelotrichaceae bacterium]|nr:hypothetical protein [Erysipelotrichaceae bacterium]MBR2600226.1 hypothetical protein [Erysipelotrichaceae bacterium]MBR3350515.1 hypothetical protein [Erysipelotrichaceae bacterium]